MPTVGMAHTKGYTSNPTKKSTTPPVTKNNAPSGPQMSTLGTPKPVTPPVTPLSNVPVLGNNVTAASTSPSGGTPYNTPGLPPGGTNPYTGFMSQFSPGAAQEQIWRDPQMVLNQMFQNSGQNLQSPMYSTMRDFYGADPQSLWLLMQGNKSYDQNGFGANQYGNFLNSLYGNYMTPGGRGVSFKEILDNVNAVGDQSGLSAQDQSPLYQLLTSGGASDQARTMYGLLGDAAKTSLSPAIASAFMDAMARQSDTYLAQNASTAGGAKPYYQYFQNPMQGR